MMKRTGGREWERGEEGGVAKRESELGARGRRRGVLLSLRLSVPAVSSPAFACPTYSLLSASRFRSFPATFVLLRRGGG